MRRARGTLLLPALVAAIGVIVVVETAIVGGGVGYLLGGAIMLAGFARLYLSLR